MIKPNRHPHPHHHTHKLQLLLQQLEHKQTLSITHAINSLKNQQKLHLEHQEDIRTSVRGKTNRYYQNINPSLENRENRSSNVFNLGKVGLRNLQMNKKSNGGYGKNRSSECELPVIEMKRNSTMCIERGNSKEKAMTYNRCQLQTIQQKRTCMRQEYDQRHPIKNKTERINTIKHITFK